LIEDEAYADLLLILNELNKGNFAPGDFAPGEVFPTHVAPVIGNEGAAIAKWGFPHWKNSSVIINARAETALDKSMFRKALRERRCVVPSSGFYEWSRSGSSEGGRKSKGKPKDKYLCRQPGEHMLYMAGFSNTFHDALGNKYDAFTILTTVANESISSIHDRMPVILAADEFDQWTQDDGFMEYVLHRPGPELSLTLTSDKPLEYYESILD